MSDLDALYRAVLDRPDDDTPRLVYADALDDLGDAARAAFVRGQVEAARVAPWEPAAVRSRCFRGDAPHGTAWAAELPALPAGLDWERLPFVRGFPARVRARDGAAFVAAADRLFDIAPVESLELVTVPVGDVAALAACRGLSRLKRLVIPEGVGQATAHKLLDSPHLVALDELDIGARLTTGRTAAAVVGSRAFGGLRSFSYHDEQRGGAMVAALAAARNPPPLLALTLQGNFLTGDGLRQLGTAPVTSTIECLDIGDNNLGPGAFEPLTAAMFPALHSLSAMRCGLGAPALAGLGATGFAPRLRVLNFGENPLGPGAGPALAALPVGSIRVLDLRFIGLGDAGLHPLLRAPWFGDLLQLDLSENGIGAAGAEALMAPGLDRLIALDLGGNPIPAATQVALRDRFGAAVLH